MSRSTERTLTIGFGLALATLLVNAVLTYANIRRVVRNEAWVVHTLNVIAELSGASSQLRDSTIARLESVQLGTNDPAEAAGRGLRAARARIQKVGTLTADNARQRQHLGRVVAGIDSL